MRHVRFPGLLVAAAMGVATLGVAHAEPAATCAEGYVVVQEGDTLRSVADRCEVEVKDLWRLNRTLGVILPPAGSQLRVPVPGQTVVPNAVIQYRPPGFRTEPGAEPVAEPAAPPPGTVVMPPRRAGGDNAPDVVMAPLEGPAGSEVELMAAGFPANAEVTVTAEADERVLEQTWTATTDAQGRADIKLTVPSDVRGDEELIFTVRSADGTARAASGVFNVGG